MSILVQREAPSFTAPAVLPDGTIDDSFSLEKFRGRHVVLFFYPLDFTFVCPTEILAFHRKLDEFHRRECEVIGISVDSQYTHHAWRETPREEGGIGAIGFPLVSDVSKNIARDYGVLVNGSVALRGTFLIDRRGIVRHQVVNDLGLGRDIDEALRTLDALRHHESSGDVCPANWKRGKKSMKATPAGVAKYLIDLAAED